jgi:hypothetical protein
MKVDGACHCGNVAFEADVDPATARICHCTDCQTMSGSLFRANIQAAGDAFRLVGGTPKFYIKTADSGQRDEAGAGVLSGLRYWSVRDLTQQPDQLFVTDGHHRPTRDVPANATDLVPVGIAVDGGGEWVGEERAAVEMKHAAFAFGQRINAAGQA